MISVIGGCAAGMMAAIMAARNGHKVQLFEKNEKLGKNYILLEREDAILPMRQIWNNYLPMW